MLQEVFNYFINTCSSRSTTNVDDDNISVCNNTNSTVDTCYDFEWETASTSTSTLSPFLGFDVDANTFSKVHRPSPWSELAYLPDSPILSTPLSGYSGYTLVGQASPQISNRDYDSDYVHIQKSTLWTPPPTDQDLAMVDDHLQWNQNQIQYNSEQYHYQYLELPAVSFNDELQTLSPLPQLQGSGLLDPETIDQFFREHALSPSPLPDKTPSQQSLEPSGSYLCQPTPVKSILFQQPDCHTAISSYQPTEQTHAKSDSRSTGPQRTVGQGRKQREKKSRMSFPVHPERTIVKFQARLEMASNQPSTPSQDAPQSKEPRHKFWCTMGCKDVGFERKGDLRRHMERTRRHEGKPWPCPEPNCNKAYARPDCVLRHQREEHS
ncbi:hypothetical protein BDN72DRAFT_919580 [Pluteus cervinus]|uniref:Uncharacterized protein n=1 Tax=Pluteus cervinus TaxID=181527 RepID=A0ACD3B8Z4_9AGAR|nr:hypothetical protein BDN72DRAFT_919580 [Pluteus cervinus]